MQLGKLQAKIDLAEAKQFKIQAIYEVLAAPIELLKVTDQNFISRYKCVLSLNNLIDLFFFV